MYNLLLLSAARPRTVGVSLFVKFAALEIYFVYMVIIYKYIYILVIFIVVIGAGMSNTSESRELQQNGTNILDKGKFCLQKNNVFF